MSDAPRGTAFEVVPLGNGRFQVDDGTIRRLAFAVVSRDTWVFLDGRVYVVPATAERAARGARGDDRGALAAPMPATVLAIHVTPGQRVARDEVLLVLEAMKMELPIRAPRDGVVSRVGCQPGELVQPGVVLLELESEGGATRERESPG